MPGDYSRRTFRRKQHYSGVLMQQGRVQLDSDWNEQLDIQLYRTETEAIDVIGRCGVPRKTGGFKIGAASSGRDLTISAGRIYVDGLLCELEEPSTYASQPYLPNPDFTTAITSPPTSPPGPSRRLTIDDGTYLVYLDAWQQERTALDDRLIREVALGGPDTAARLRNVWQVKLIGVNETSPPSSPPEGGFTCKSRFREFQRATAQSTGRLNAQTAPPRPDEDPCLLPPTSGYSLLENQLYRVEVQTGGTLTQAGGPVTFKWSRDNASVETTVVSINDTITTVADIGKDELLSFANGQWVEVVDEEATLKSQPHPLVQIDSVRPATREIVFKSSLTAFATTPDLKLRRWDESTGANASGLPASAGVWLDLEAGIQVQFSTGTYHAGDYWLIPARTATREIEWPPFEIPNTHPIAQPPRGIRHHFCRLALLEVRDGRFELKDCRTTFPPLTELMSFFHVGGTGQEAQPGERLPCPLEVGVTNGQVPVAGARVRFVVSPGAGVLQGGGASGGSIIVATDEDGVAQCVWQLGSSEQRQRCLRVEATLLDDAGQAEVPSLHFTANFVAGGAEEPGIRVRQIVAIEDERPLRNDTLVPVNRLQKGIAIVCDDVMAVNAGGGFPPPSTFPAERIPAKPVAFVTIDLPYPIGADATLWDFNEIVGFQPLILGGNVSIQERRIVWSPSTRTNEWLQRILFVVLRRREITDRILAHLTVKGNFIFGRENPRLNLDGDLFGVPRREDGIDIELPSGDSRRGGDLDMWFWLAPAEADQPPGLNLSVTVTPGPSGATIRGLVRDNAGAAIPNAAVTLTGPIGTRTATTNADGAFAFINLTRGTYRVSVQVGGLSAEQTVTV